MPKAFLAHSSNEKRFIRSVVKRLGLNNCIYDELVFEEGMKTFEEIEKGLAVSDIFVVFLSEGALNSEWVKRELCIAHELFGQGILRRIYPLIIDENITHLDPRIPLWIREEYNLKYISRPAVAERRIRQRLREISWDLHPRIEERERIFVGRNDLIKIFEERIDSVEDPTPVCFIAGGLKKIGRRSLILHCLNKTNRILSSYQPPIIELDARQSLEDFIHKVYDLGFSSDIDLTNFMKKSVKEKLEIALSLIKDLQKTKEILFIYDRGCIVTHDRILSNWFADIVLNMRKDNIITFAIFSIFRPHIYKMINLEHVFSMEVPELDIKERKGLLRRYSDFEKLDLSLEDFNYLSDLQKGYPEQIFYTVNLIKEIGMGEIRKKPYLIADFTTEKVSKVLAKYEQDENSMNFLRLLAKFSFISYDLIFKIVNESEKYEVLLKELLASAICEYLGANKEYIRLNDVVSDYINRSKIPLPEEYQNRLKEHAASVIKNFDPEDYDVSDFVYSIKNALVSGIEVEEKYLIPSHFLSTMVELYDSHKKYAEVIKLADRVLQNEKFMDPAIEHEIRYFLCLSLARLRNERFKKEVQKMKDYHHDFLFGFYYRLLGDSKNAIERLRKALDRSPYSKLAKRELVAAYVYAGEFEKALDLAKENYENEKNNPYHIGAYFSCLIRPSIRNKNIEKMKELLIDIKKIETHSDRAKEMATNLEAQFIAFCEDDYEKSMLLIDSAINDMPDKFYLLLTKFDISEKFERFDIMKNTLDVLEKRTKTSPYFYNHYLRRKAIYLSFTGETEKALDLVRRHLKNLPDSAREKLEEKISKIEARNT